MKIKRAKRSKNKTVKPQAKVVIKLRPWGGFIDETYRLESALARKPKLVHIEFAGTGEIPADSALLMRSIILKRSASTRIVTSARSSLQGASALIWLLGDTRHIREDARLYFAPAGPFVASDAPAVWRDRNCYGDNDEIEKDDYIQVLHAINEFLPVKELAGRPVEIAVLKQFGLVDNAKADEFLAAAFQKANVQRSKPRATRKKEVKEASR